MTKRREKEETEENRIGYNLEAPKLNIIPKDKGEKVIKVFHPYQVIKGGNPKEALFIVVTFHTPN